jgi:hypothetical protein
LYPLLAFVWVWQWQGIWPGIAAAALVIGLLLWIAYSDRVVLDGGYLERWRRFGTTRVRLQLDGLSVSLLGDPPNESVVFASEGQAFRLSLYVTRSGAPWYSSTKLLQLIRSLSARGASVGADVAARLEA